METVVTQDQLAEIHAKLDYLVEPSGGAKTPAAGRG